MNDEQLKILEKQIEILSEALRFYANRENYLINPASHPVANIFFDSGQRAKDALAGILDFSTYKHSIEWVKND